MKKKLIIVTGVVLAVAAALLLAKSELLQGRLGYFQSQRLSSSMRGLCLTPEQYYEKYVKPFEEKKEENTGGNTSRDDSNSRSGGGSEGEEKTIIVVPPDFSVGRTPSGGVLEDNKEDYTEPEEEVTEDGSKEKPYSEYVDCKCGEAGKNLGTYQKEQGTYYSKICMAPPFWQCVRPQYKCPEGTEPDFVKITEICKKEKVKSCFSAAKPGGETYNMCKALSSWVFDLECVSEPECKEYLEMSVEEIDKYIQAFGLPEEFFAKGGNKYKPKNAKEKQQIEEVNTINNCYDLYSG